MVTKKSRLLLLAPKAVRYVLRNGLPDKTVVLSAIGTRRQTMPLPSFIQLEPTTKCNMNCAMCTRAQINPGRLNKDLGVDEFKHILSQIPTLRKIKIQGMGEPLMNKHLWEILEEGNKQGIEFSTISNGTIINGHEHRIVKCLSEIRISIHSTDAEQFKEITGGANLSHILDQVGRLCKLKKVNNARTIIALTMVATHENYEQIPDIVELGEKLGVDEVGIVEVENWKIPGEREDTKNLKSIFKKQGEKESKL